MVEYFGPACLAGIPLLDWIGLLAENRFQISPRYWAKGAFISGSSVCTSICRPIETLLYGKRVRNEQPQTPLFILGCWRSGTTHLHNLLSLDERFGCPTLFQTMYPHTFLMAESWWQPMLELLTPKKRFMDNMEQSLTEPHEDEMALAIMSRRSNMLSWGFPKNSKRYDTFLDFEDATDHDRQLWKNSLELFVRKVSLRTGKHLVLKSPNHTARVKLILEVYPDAKFLHIRRHPYDVFRSMCHMASKVQPVWGLQYMPPEEIPDMVIATYRRLYDAYLDQAAQVPDAQLLEISYEQLVADTPGTLADVYQTLHLGGYEEYRPRLEAYLAQQASYRKNKHADLPDEDRQKLQTEWQRFFDAWGYESA